MLFGRVSFPLDPMPRSKSASRVAKSPKNTPPNHAEDAKLIDAMIREVPGWRAEALTRFRRLIHAAVPDVVEEVKWRKPSNPDGVPVWSCDGILCTSNIWKDHVRLTFGNGARLGAPAGFFNAALNGNYMRALDLRQGDNFDEAVLMRLLRAAVEYNRRSRAARKP